MKRSLEEALKLATVLKYETKDGGSGVDQCSECNKETFEIAGASDGGLYNYGECLHCGYIVSEKDANNQELDYKIRNY